MAKLPNPYICDVCGTQKRETNRWYASRARIEPDVASEQGILFLPWEVAEHLGVLENANVQHLCSEQCCIKALSKWLESQKA